MFGSCPVVRIVHDNPDGFVEINASDFDPAVHERFDDTPVSSAKTEAVDEARAVGRAPKTK